MSIFEKASRIRLMFDMKDFAVPRYTGTLDVSDLWSLPLVVLDVIAITLHLRLKESDTISFVSKTKNTDEVVQLRFDIVKHIIEVRMAEQEKAEARAKNKLQRERIQELIARKENAQLEEAPMEDLRKLLADMEASD